MAEKDLWLRGYKRFCADPEGRDEPTDDWLDDEREGYRHAFRLELLHGEDPRTLDPETLYEALRMDPPTAKAVEETAGGEVTFLEVFHDDCALYEIRGGAKVRVRRDKPGTLGGEISRLVDMHGSLIWVIDLGGDLVTIRVKLDSHGRPELEPISYQLGGNEVVDVTRLR